MSDAKALRVDRGEFALHGESVGEGPPVVLVHGLSATRGQVVHGSKALPRAGYAVSSYDARGHGASDPPPGGRGYDYELLADDLEAVVEAVAPGARCVLAGHSMGAHTIAALALREPDRFAGVVLIGPSYAGVPTAPDALAHWDALADALERDGVEGFLDVYAAEVPAAWRDTVLRFTRARLERHEHLPAVAQALREVPRSRPFEGLEELELCRLPALVVASHDDADPSHPYAVAEAWAERLPEADLVSEDLGSSPLAWQGGRLSREIAAFGARDAVAARLAG